MSDFTRQLQDGSMHSKEEYLRQSVKKPDWVCNLEDEVSGVRQMLENMTAGKKYSKYMIFADPSEAPPGADLLEVVSYDEPFNALEALPLLSPVNPQNMCFQQQYPMTGNKTFMQRKNKFLFGIPISEDEVGLLRKELSVITEQKYILTKGQDLNLVELEKEKKVSERLQSANNVLLKQVTDAEKRSKENAVLVVDNFVLYKQLEQKLGQYEAQELSPLIETPVIPVVLEDEKPEPVLSEDQLQQLGEMVENAVAEKKFPERQNQLGDDDDYASF